MPLVETVPPVASPDVLCSIWGGHSRPITITPQVDWPRDCLGEWNFTSGVVEEE